MKKQEDEKSQVTPQQRRPYVAPRIEETGHFEHMTLTCAMSAGAPECIATPMGRSVM